MAVTAEVLTIRLTDANWKVLRHWASLERTISRAIELIDNLAAEDDEGAGDCMDELRDIGPIMDSVHMQIKNHLRQAGG